MQGEYPASSIWLAPFTLFLLTLFPKLTTTFIAQFSRGLGTFSHVPLPPCILPSLGHYWGLLGPSCFPGLYSPFSSWGHRKRTLILATALRHFFQLVPR